MRRGFDAGRIAGTHAPSCEDNAQDAALEPWCARGADHFAAEALLKAVNQGAWRMQTRQLDDGRLAEMQPSSERQMLQLEPACRDILAEFSRTNRMAGCTQFVQELSPDQVDLSVIRSSRPHPGDEPVSNMSAGVGVTFHAVIFDKGNLLPGPLAEGVLRVAGDSNDRSIFVMHARHTISKQPRSLAIAPQIEAADGIHKTKFRQGMASDHKAARYGFKRDFRSGP